MPTETVYGLGVDASSPDAVARIFAAKGRPSDHPVIVHLADAGFVDDWALDVPPVARSLAEAFWPGPLTLILRRRPHVLDAVTGGQDTVGLRVPNHPVALALLQAFGGGIAAPSANRFGRVSPTDHRHVLADLGPFLVAGRDAILAGGTCAVGVESTIVDCSGDNLAILRPGGVTAEQLAPFLDGRGSGAVVGVVRAPGLLAAHYAPAAVVELVDETAVARRVAELDGHHVGVLGPRALAFPPQATRLPAPHPYTGATLAPIVYARLREADALGLEFLVVVAPPDDGLGAAVLDRLRRAAVGSARAHADGHERGDYVQRHVP